jgi:hypothetical protein
VWYVVTEEDAPAGKAIGHAEVQRRVDASEASFLRTCLVLVLAAIVIAIVSVALYLSAVAST